MKLTSVKKAEQLIEKLKKTGAQELPELEAVIKKITEQKDAAANKMTKAVETGGPAAYQDAKAEYNNAIDSLEMYARRREYLQSRPLISQAQYEEVVSDICQEMAEAETSTIDTLEKLAEQMNAAAVELEEAQAKANKVLATLQHDIYRDADRSRDKDGRIKPIFSEIKKVDKWQVINWGKSAVKNKEYISYTGR